MIQMFYTSFNPFLFLVIVKLTFVNSDEKLGVCSSSHQISALDVQKAHGCEPRHELIQIEIPPQSSIIQMIPSHVNVRRCRGTCLAHPEHSCQHATQKKVNVPVMVVTAGFRTGMLDTRCDIITVMEDDTCQCGCHVTSDTCNNKFHVFNPHACQCQCSNFHVAKKLLWTTPRVGLTCLRMHVSQGHVETLSDRLSFRLRQKLRLCSCSL